MPYPTLKVEAALGVGSGGYLILDDATLGRLDTGLLGPDLAWSDLSADVISCRVKSPARARLWNAYQAGSATVVLNNKSSNYDPDNTAGAYAAAGVSALYGSRPIRVSATYGGVDYPLWYGYTKQWAPRRDGFGRRTTVVTATDGFRLLGGQQSRVAQTAQGAGELAGARVNRILDDARWPTSLRDLDAGYTTLQATTLTGNALSEVQLVAASENGSTFIDRTGRLVFRDRYAMFTRPRSFASQCTWAESAAGGELAATEITPAFDDDQLITRVNLARVGGTVQTADDPLAQTIYANDVPRSWGRTDLLNQSDTEVAAAAGWILASTSRPFSRIDSVRVQGNPSAAALWPKLLDVQVQDLQTVIRRPANMAAVTRRVFVEGFEHDYKIDTAAQITWESTLTYAPADAYQGFLILDDATLGLLDAGRLGY